MAATASSVPPDSRLTFHPDHEVPLLRSWYRACANPTNEKFAMFAYELNKGYIRQDRPKVTAEKIKIWWKNERQREKRQKAPSTEPQPGSSSASTGEGQSEGCSVKNRLRTRLKRPKLATDPTREGSERSDECIVIEDSETGDTSLQYRSLQHWSGAGSADHRHSGPRAVPGESPPLSTTTTTTATAATPPSSHGGKDLPHKQGHQGRRQPATDPAARKSSATTEMTFVPQSQDHPLLPGQPLSSLSWQSNFVYWSSQRGSRAGDVELPPVPGPPLPWPHHYPAPVSQRGGSREGEPQGEATAASSHEDYRQMERFKYSQDMPFGSPSSSMDFSNIL